MIRACVNVAHLFAAIFILPRIVYASVTLSESMVPMRDGVQLYTRAIIPDGGKKFPCVFSRTPYPRGVELEVPYPQEIADKNVCAARGYVEVVQHCRGFGRSDGLCVPYQEREDGLDTLTWIRNQPWYNGEIFLSGGSYLSSVHLLYLSAEPLDIKGAALSIQTDRMYFRNYRNGCCYNWCNFSWWRSMMRRTYPNAKSDNEVIVRPYKDIAKRAFGVDVPVITDQYMHTENDEIWTSDPRENVMSHIKFPVLWTEGWWDFYLEGMTSMWERMLPEWKAKSCMVMAGRGHASKGALTNTTIPCARQVEHQVSAFDFFDSIRSGTSIANLELGKMRAYLIGADEWFSTEWPLTKVVFDEYSLSSDGRLLADGQIKNGEVSWTYNPNQKHGDFRDSLSVKAFDNCKADFAAAFVSSEFSERKDFFGRPRIRIPVSSDCEDTQFLFRIDLVTPSKEAWSVCQTITSIRNVYKNYQPGEVVILEVEFPLIAFSVQKDWCVRLDVTSEGGSYVPHANIAKHWAEVTDDEVKIAHNRVICKDAKVLLPLRK